MLKFVLNLDGEDETMTPEEEPTEEGAEPSEEAEPMASLALDGEEDEDNTEARLHDDENDEPVKEDEA